MHIAFELTGTAQMKTIDCQTEPSRYRHWKLEFEGEIASLIMDVDPAGGLST